MLPVCVFSHPSPASSTSADSPAVVLMMKVSAAPCTPIRMADLGDEGDEVRRAGQGGAGHGPGQGGAEGGEGDAGEGGCDQGWRRRGWGQGRLWPREVGASDEARPERGCNAAASAAACCLQRHSTTGSLRTCRQAAGCLCQSMLHCRGARTGQGKGGPNAALTVRKQACAHTHAGDAYAAHSHALTCYVVHP